MAYEFKKLSDVNVIEAMKDGLNVLVEDGGEIVKLAANSMIPEDVALKSDIVLAPTVASVGQTIVVKSVDESGKPTEWEAMDISAGGDATEKTVEATLSKIANSVHIVQIENTYNMTMHAIPLDMGLYSSDVHEFVEQYGLIAGETYTLKLGEDTYQAVAAKQGDTVILSFELSENVMAMITDYDITRNVLLFGGADYTAGELYPDEYSLSGKFAIRANRPEIPVVQILFNDDDIDSNGNVKAPVTNNDGTIFINGHGTDAYSFAAIFAVKTNDIKITFMPRTGASNEDVCAYHSWTYIYNDSSVVNNFRIGFFMPRNHLSSQRDCTMYFVGEFESGES